MSLRRKLVVTFVLCVLSPLAAMAQNTDPVAAGADPATNNFDVYPGFWPIDNKGSNFDVECIGANPGTTNEDFVIFGVANDSQCGPKKSIFDKNGLIYTNLPGFLDNSSGDFITPAVAIGYGGVGGFGWTAAVSSDAGSGEFIVHNLFFNNDVDYPFTNVDGLVYGQSSLPDHFEDHGVFQRFDRYGNKISNFTCGRNVPSAVSHTDGANFKADNHESQSGGCAILSNGNSLFYVSDRTRDSGTLGDPSVVTYFKSVVPVFHADTAGDGNRCNVHTVANAAATTFVVNTTPTFHDTSNHTTFGNRSVHGAAAGEGFFACRVDNNNGTLAVFRNNGTRIAQIFGVGALYEANDTLTLNADDTITAGNRIALSAGANRLYYGARFQAHGAGPLRPCILPFIVDTVGGSVTAQDVITPDDDYAVAATGDVHADSIDCDSNIHGDIVVCWRKHPSEPNGGGAPVCRVYNDDGSAETGSFYPSALSPSDTDVATSYDADQADVKGAIGDNTVAVCWFTMNGLTPAEMAALDCGGNPRDVGVAARIFTVSVTDVQDWDLY